MQLQLRRLLANQFVLLAGAAAAVAVPIKVFPAPAGGGGQDVIHPASTVGTWRCERRTVSVQGNAAEALAAWEALGGGGGAETFRGGKGEVFSTRFIPAPEGTLSAYTFEGKEVQGVVQDRGFETASRGRAAEVKWDMKSPDTLTYKRDGAKGGVELSVVQRKVEMPNDKGWGGSELVRYTVGGLSGTAEVKRRFRRAFDEGGKRVVEGLEIVKTFEGGATERPTSVAKFQIRMSRMPDTPQ